MQVLAYDPYLSADVMRARGAAKVELDELMRRADFVSINCPLTAETRKLIGAREYALMQPTAYFITTARGSIHDEEALERALRDKKIAGAGLDVWEKEPPPAEHPLMKYDNVMVTAAHGRRHRAKPRARMGQIRRRADARCARRQAGAAHHQSAGLAGLCQALRAHLRLRAAAPAGGAELARLRGKCVIAGTAVPESRPRPGRDRFTRRASTAPDAAGSTVAARGVVIDCNNTPNGRRHVFRHLKRAGLAGLLLASALSRTRPRRRRMPGSTPNCSPPPRPRAAR